MNNSSENRNCHQSPPSDCIEEIIAAMARLSIRGQLCPPLSAACNKDPQITTRVPLATSETIESTDAQVKPQKKNRDDVLSEDIEQFVLWRNNQEEPEPIVLQAEERTKCERIERTNKPKPKRGRELHKNKSSCCPVL
ncbi:hypothetical protein FQN60_005565 [Etheostoma spectabile]|uniref:Uncharacterized protein n=1 Tax=Etheostoma spectabile TaxID=54343 RepID=A0A5J5CII1_9PERO|nr:hypothetical protein FQN60_005565 [Etheostoma spectabile]